MTLTLTVPTAGGVPLGIGYSLRFHQTTLPVPNDDYLETALFDPASGFVLIASTHIMLANANPQFIFGKQDVQLVGHVGIQQALAVGAAVNLTALQKHANGTLVDTMAPIGFLWEPIQGVGNIVQYFGLLPTTAPSVGAILAAVQKSFS